jgi:hypothetical protein
MSYSFTVSEQAFNEEENTITETPVVSVSVGSLSLVSYAAREARDLLSGDKEYSVELVDNDDETGRAIVRLSADGDTVTTVVGARLAKLRKAVKASTEAGTEA